MVYEQPLLCIVSDAAVSAVFANEINLEANMRVISLCDALDRARHPAVTDLVPSYGSLQVEFDPLLADTAEISAWITSCFAQPVISADVPGRTVEIPVCYGGSFGPDLDDVSKETGLPPDEVISIHTAGHYRVYMIGFSPGFPYLGGMDSRIAAPRLKTPRKRIPAGSVGIAGAQTGIYPTASPGGWRLIGRTPLKLFDKFRGNPFLLSAGDSVRFFSVSESVYKEYE